MNKIMKTLAVAAVATMALCGSAMAAPKGGQPPKCGARVEQRAQPRPAAKAKPKAAQRHDIGHKAKPARHVAQRKPPAPRHEVRRPEPPRRPEPKHHRHHHHNTTLHTEDWCSLGASLVGGIVGGIIGAAL